MWTRRRVAQQQPGPDRGTLDLLINLFLITVLFVLLSPFYRGGNQGTESKSLAQGRTVSVQQILACTQATWLPGLLLIHVGVRREWESLPRACCLPWLGLPVTLLLHGVGSSPH